MTDRHELANGDSETFWEAARTGRLVLQRCENCGHVQFPPRHQCVRCWEPRLVDVESAGRGVVESFTIVRRAPTAAFRDKIPYVIASIVVDEGPRLITGIVGDDALAVDVDDRVEVAFVGDGDAAALPRFRRVT